MLGAPAPAPAPIRGDDFRREPTGDWVALMGGALVPLDMLELGLVPLVAVVALVLRGELGVGEGLGERLAGLESWDGVVDRAFGRAWRWARNCLTQLSTCWNPPPRRTSMAINHCTCLY